MSTANELFKFDRIPEPVVIIHFPDGSKKRIPADDVVSIMLRMYPSEQRKMFRYGKFWRESNKKGLISECQYNECGSLDGWWVNYGESENGHRIVKSTYLYDRGNLIRSQHYKNETPYKLVTYNHTHFNHLPTKTITRFNTSTGKIQLITEKLDSGYISPASKMRYKRISDTCYARDGKTIIATFKYNDEIQKNNVVKLFYPDE